MVCGLAKCSSAAPKLHFGRRILIIYNPRWVCEAAQPCVMRARTKSGALVVLAGQILFPILFTANSP